MWAIRKKIQGMGRDSVTAYEKPKRARFIIVSIWYIDVISLQGRVLLIQKIGKQLVAILLTFQLKINILFVLHHIVCAEICL